VDEWRTGE